MITRIFIALVTAASGAGCLYQNVRVDPVKVEPIHMTVDVNLHDAHDMQSPAPPRLEH